MSAPVIRLLAAENLDDALALSTSAGWNQQHDDWRMLLRLAPAGSFAALSDGRIVGTAIGIDYGGFAWVAMMLVDPAYRGRGVGGQLLEAAMAAVPSHLPVRLDATPLGRPLYERYGFTEEAKLTRHVADGSSDPVVPVAAKEPHVGSARVRQLTAVDLETVTNQDRQIFGGDRRVVLEWALHSAPRYAHAAQNESGLTHYCLGREGRLFDQIGPVVAADDETAQRLVNATLLNASGRPVALDAFDSQRTFTAWLGTRGFREQRPLFRMCLPRRNRVAPKTSRPTLVEFTIFGPEFG